MAPVTNPPVGEPTQEDFDRLHYLVTHLVKAAFDGEVRLVTTDHTGVVDAAWLSEGEEIVRAEMAHWLAASAPEVRKLTLGNLGAMLVMYAEHPRRNPLVSVVTYPEWPSMVEVHLYE